MLCKAIEGVTVEHVARKPGAEFDVSDEALAAALVDRKLIEYVVDAPDPPATDEELKPDHDPDDPPELAHHPHSHPPTLDTAPKPPSPKPTL